MLRKWMTLVALLALVGLIAGCSDDTVDPQTTELSSSELDDLAAIALATDEMTVEEFNAELDAMEITRSSSAAGGEIEEPIVTERSFSRSRPCPGEGTFHVEGNIVRSYWPEAAVLEAEATGSRTRTDCVFPRGELTVTVNSNSNWDIFRRRVERRPDGPQASDYFGSFSFVRSDGQERSCEFEIHVVRDPETGTRTVEGTTCDTAFSRTVPWSPVGDGPA
jgi:hypothetical protein